MATPAFDTDADKPLDNTQDPNKPLPQIAPNQVAVNPPGGDTGAGVEAATTPASTSGQVGTSSGSAQNAPGAGTTGTSGPVVSNIPGPGSQPAAAASAAGPGSQPATVPAAQPAAPSGGGPTTAPAAPAPKPPGTQVTENANGSSSVTQQAGTSITAGAPDNSRFTDTTQSQDRQKSVVRGSEGGTQTRQLSYGRGEAESSYHRDAQGNIATNENLAGPEEYTQKTSARDDGHGGYIVDFVKFDPKGKPLSPALDIAGWNSLTPEQRVTAMQDYKNNMDKWMKDTGVTKPAAEGLDPEFFESDTFKNMPPEAQAEAVQAWLDGEKTKSDEAATKLKDTPKINVGADGSAKLANSVDSKGNLIHPMDAPEWDSLSPEQQDSLMEQFEKDSEALARGGKPGEDQDFKGTGMSESEFRALSPKDQNYIRKNPGWRAPQHNTDGSTTFSEKPADGSSVGHSYTEDANGRKTSETWPPTEGGFLAVPITRTYGADGSTTDTIGTGEQKTVITQDSQGGRTTTTSNGFTVTEPKDGEKSITVKKGSPAEQTVKLGFGPDGERLSLEQSLAATLGIPVSQLTDVQRTSLHNQASEASTNPESWKRGKAMGLLALQAGLITQQEFNAIDSRKESGASWGAWSFANRDIVSALEGAGMTADMLDGLAAESGFQMPQMADYGFQEELLGRIAKGYGREGQVDASSLAGVDLGSVLDPATPYVQSIQGFKPGDTLERVMPALTHIAASEDLSPQQRGQLLAQSLHNLGARPNDPNISTIVHKLFENVDNWDLYARMWDEVQKYGGYHLETSEIDAGADGTEFDL